MSARNYLSAREKNVNKEDCLPYIHHQKFGRRSELPVLSANAYNLFNRNLLYSFNQHFVGDCLERSGTPFSDFFSESETGTPDFHSEESDSSAGSILKRNTAEATKTLADEWERIERTLYNEEGEKCTRPHIVEECKQWQQLHPQLRITGKAIPTADKRYYRQVEHEEIIAMHYSDYEEFSESEERLSQSSNDVTPTSSPRSSIDDIQNPKLFREKISYATYKPDFDLPDTFNSLLHITPIQIHSPLYKKRQNQSILRSDVASSKWMRTYRPDSSINLGRNSAKSYISLDARNLCNLNSLERKKDSGRVFTARLRDSSHLQPLYSPESQPSLTKTHYGMQPQLNIRKVSLPPLLLEEEKRKVILGSAKVTKQIKHRKNNKAHNLERMKHS